MCGLGRTDRATCPPHPSAATSVKPCRVSFSRNMGDSSIQSGTGAAGSPGTGNRTGGRGALNSIPVDGVGRCTVPVSPSAGIPIPVIGPPGFRVGERTVAVAMMEPLDRPIEMSSVP